jgi:aspartyl/asparaginyl-tRNA synthetase
VVSDLKSNPELKDQNIGSCMLIRGKVTQSPGKGQKIELSVEGNGHWVKILGKCDISTYKLIKSKDRIKLEVRVMNLIVRP